MDHWLFIFGISCLKETRELLIDFYVKSVLNKALASAVLEVSRILKQNLKRLIMIKEGKLINLFTKPLLKTAVTCTALCSFPPTPFSQRQVVFSTGIRKGLTAMAR